MCLLCDTTLARSITVLAVYAQESYTKKKKKKKKATQNWKNGMSQLKHIDSGAAAYPEPDSSVILLLFDSYLHNLKSIMPCQEII